MKSSKILEISQYWPTAEDKLFFDTNVWMYLFCPIGNYNAERVAQYARFLKRGLRVGAKVYISSLILSEFYNSYARLEFNLWRRKSGNHRKSFKKHFRKTSQYQRVAQDIKLVIQSQILKFAEKINDDLAILEFERLFHGIERSDFNDNYYLALCEKRGFKFISDDRDFHGHDFDMIILTCNKELLYGQS